MSVFQQNALLTFLPMQIISLLALWTTEEGYCLESSCVHWLLPDTACYQPRSAHMNGQLGTALWLELGESQLVHSRAASGTMHVKTGQQYSVV